MAERCPRCHRKKFTAGRASNPDLCHRTASSECEAARQAHARCLATTNCILRGVVDEICRDDGDDLVDSIGVEAFAKAMRHLAKSGVLRIERDHGSDVVGRWS